MAPVLQVQLLGGFGLEVEDEPLPSLGARDATSLFAYLVFHRDTAHTRDLLAGRFWSDQPDHKARKRLSNALWKIRKTVAHALGVERVILANGNTLRFDPTIEVEVDVEVFVRRLDELQRRRQANTRSVTAEDQIAVVDGYKGDLLSGYYDDWIELPRKQINDRYLAAVEQLVHTLTRSADYDAALRYARILVSEGPLSDEWQRILIRLYAMNGQPSAAEQQYERYAAALAEELGAQPSRELAALVERIRYDITAGAAAAPVVDEDDRRPALAGRVRERSHVMRRVNDLLDGGGGVVLIEGEAGIGKSRLMEEIIAGAEWRDVGVMVGTHSPTSALTPFDGLLQALEPVVVGLRGERLATQVAPVWLKQASTLLPPLASMASGHSDAALRPAEEPWRTSEALARILLAQAQPHPALLVLEDVHWCDEETVQVLGQLGDRLVDSGLLVCLTYQRHKAQESASLWRTLGDMEARPGASRVSLRPLSDDEVRDLVVAEVGPGRLSEPALAMLVASSAGNPYVVLELLRATTDVLDEEFFAEATTDNTGSVAPWLKDVLAQRIGAASDDVREVLEAAAVAGGTLSTSMLTRITGLSAAEVLGALSRAVALGFMVETSTGCEFAQEQSRLLIYDEVEEEHRRRLHGSVIDALDGLTAVGVERLAYHADRAERWQESHRYHLSAAQAAVRANAFQTAAEHFDMSDEAALAAGMPDADRIDDLLAYEWVLDVLGRRADQQKVLDRLEHHDLPASLGTEVAQRRAWLLANTDRGAEAAELAARMAVVARNDGVNPGELLTIVGVAQGYSGDFAQGIPPLEEAVEVLEASGDSAVFARVMLGSMHGELDNIEEATRQLDQAYLQAKEAHDARSQVEALGHLASVYMKDHNDAKAEASFVEALNLAMEIGYRYGEGRNLVNLSLFYFRLGRGGKALTLADRATDVFESLGNGRGVAFVKMNGSLILHLLVGDDDSAAAQAEEAAVYFRSVEDLRHEAMCLNTLAGIDLRRGRRRLAKRRLTAARQQSSPVDDPTTMAEIRINLALVEFDLGNMPAALEEAGQARSLQESRSLSSLAAPVLVVEARIRHAMGDLQGALNLVNRAIPLNRVGTYRAPVIAWWAAQVLQAAGQDAAAQEQVVRADQLLRRELDELPESMMASAWAVTEHRELAEARERVLIEVVERRLPSVDAPRGRPLLPADLVDVVWTLSQPDDWELPADGARRQHRIQRLLAEAEQQHARARAVDIADVLGVSERTVKRDLAELRDKSH